jgi:hypothetical protein
MGHLDLPRRGVAWAKVAGIFVCMVGAYNASYSTKYLLVRHLGHKHDLATKLGKYIESFTWHKRLRCQDHASMVLVF